jgi:hypothetical protein
MDTIKELKASNLRLEKEAENAKSDLNGAQEYYD